MIEQPDRSADALDYMQAMLGQLRNMAEAGRYDMLAYLIELACIEATDVAAGRRPARLSRGRLGEHDRDSAA
ncbi:MAG: hypothetical protein JNL61_09510 [Rhizobiaceae bacterium]|nr:hypothetical protein [Rhizobiaceae bacterium]